MSRVSFQEFKHRLEGQYSDGFQKLFTHDPFTNKYLDGFHREDLETLLTQGFQSNHGDVINPTELHYLIKTVELIMNEKYGGKHSIPYKIINNCFLYSDCELTTKSFLSRLNTCIRISSLTSRLMDK